MRAMLFAAVFDYQLTALPRCYAACWRAALSAAHARFLPRMSVSRFFFRHRLRCCSRYISLIPPNHTPDSYSFRCRY